MTNDYKGATITIAKYTGDELDLIKVIYDELNKEAQYVGEDGDMVCHASNAHEALLKFKKRLLTDVGEEEAEMLDIDNVGVGWLFLVDENNKEHEHMIGESEWFANWYGDKRSDFEIFVYHY